MTVKRILIVGAGLAGLTAGVRLTDAGYQVTVLERNNVPGGRVRRIILAGNRAPIDWGQHLMLGCYYESLSLIKRLGTAEQVRRIKGITPFISGSGKVHPYRLGRLPAPLHLLPGLFNLTQISLRDRLMLGRAMLAAKLETRLQPDSLDVVSAARWLNEKGQSRQAIAGFWEPLVKATLNLPTEEASALLLTTVIDKGFFARRKDAVPLLPRTTLHDLFVKPAIKVIESNSGQVLYKKKVHRLVREKSGEISTATTKKGERWEADIFLLAVSNWEIVPLANENRFLGNLSKAAKTLSASPIVCVELWFDRPWMRYPYAGFLGSPVQWAFNHDKDSEIPGRSTVHRVSLVISHAEKYEKMKKEAIIEKVVAEVHRYFPEAQNATIMRSHVIKARRATFRAGTGRNGLRPKSITACRNLFLAGDWTATGLPATIESAITSGNQAAKTICKM